MRGIQDGTKDSFSISCNVNDSKYSRFVDSKEFNFGHRKFAMSVRHPAET